MSISQINLKILWAQSGGLCAFPGCNEELICKTTNDIIGNICHIIAKKPNGPRGDASIPSEILDSTDNLILLCPTHHAIIDADTETYTIGKLKEMKWVHQINIYDKLHVGSKWKVNFSQLYYINIPRLSIISAMSGMELHFDFMERFNCLHSMGFQLNHLMFEIKKVIEQLDISSIPLPHKLSELKVGQTIEFTNKFRTKNMPYPDKVLKNNFMLTGNIDKDPHIYLKSKGIKLILTLDPTWVTTSTSFTSFLSGWIDVAGLAIIKKVTETQIFASPYLLGIPKTAWDDIFALGNSARSIELP